MQSLSVDCFLYDTNFNWKVFQTRLKFYTLLVGIYFYVVFAICQRLNWSSVFFLNFSERQKIMFIYGFLRVGSTFILLWDKQTWLLLYVTLLLNIYTMFLLFPVHLLWTFLELKDPLKNNVVLYINQLTPGLKVHSRWFRRFQTTLKNSSYSYIAFSGYSTVKLCCLFTFLDESSIKQKSNDKKGVRMWNFRIIKNKNSLSNCLNSFSFN